MNSLRDRTRLAVREDVLVQAWRLFWKQGFDGTTVEQIAEASGMSRRSFFRYFATKEELVLIRLIEHDVRMAERLASHPADESVWTAIRAAMSTLVDSYEVDADRSRALLRMLREPSLRGTLGEREQRWIAAFTPLVNRRLADSSRTEVDDPRAAAIAGAALACLQAAQIVWLTEHDKRLTDLLDDAMDAIANL